MVARMSKVASSPAVAIVGAGAVLANPGAFIPLALKSISETDPSAAGMPSNGSSSHSSRCSRSRSRSSCSSRRTRPGAFWRAFATG
jgi:hypothetical protein